MYSFSIRDILIAKCCHVTDKKTSYTFTEIVQHAEGSSKKKLWNNGCRHVRQSALVYDSVARIQMCIHIDYMDMNSCSEVLEYKGIYLIE